MRYFDIKKYTPVDIEPVYKMALENPAELVRSSEEYYSRQVVGAAEEIKADRGSRFVLLCGPSASGKTTTAHKLKRRLVQIGVGARVVSMDNFFMGVESYPQLADGKPDMESIKAVDLDHLNECFEELLQSGRAFFPVYDFVRQEQRRGEHEIVLEKGDVLIMEGIHALNPQVLSHIPRENIFRMYVSVRTKFVSEGEEVLNPKDIRLTRRMVRDNKFRNYPPLATLEQWMHVLEGERQNINPYRDDVDLKMDNTIDYEVCVWHDLLTNLLESVDQSEYEKYPEIDRIFKGLTRFPRIDHKLIPKTSLLREFIGEEI